MEALRTVLYSFKIDTESSESCLDAIQSVLYQYFPCLSQTQRISLGASNGFLVVYSAQSIAITFTLRYYQSEQLFTLNGEGSKAWDIEFTKFNNHVLENLKEDLEKALKLQNIERLPVQKRNSSVPLYFLTSDNRALEYNFDKVLVHEKSQFQNIKVLHSPTLGNTLLLDDLQNLAEGDLNYTRGLMNYGKNVYKGISIYQLYDSWYIQIYALF